MLFNTTKGTRNNWHDKGGGKVYHNRHVIFSILASLLYFVIKGICFCNGKRHEYFRDDANQDGWDTDHF
jgi:hypothetical protein